MPDVEGSSNVLPFPQTAPIGRIPDEVAPTVTGDSPYTPLNLPQVETKHPMPDLGKEADPQNLGAVSHAGAVAYLADKVLRGAVQGIAQKQAHQQDQYNKKLTAQQSIYNDQSKQLYDMAKAGVDPNSQEFKDARNRVLTSWQATMQSVGEKMPQPGKGGKKKQDDSPLAAVYQAAVSTGPPVFHQIAPYLTPQYQAQKKQGAQTAATQAGAAQSTAELTAKKTQLENTLLEAESKGDKDGADKAKQALSDLQEATSPYRRPTGEENKRADYQALLTSGQVPKDAQNNPLSYEAWTASQGAAGRVAGNPQPVKFDPNTKSVFDHKTGKQYFGNEPDMTPEVASAFVGAKNAVFEKQQLALARIAASSNQALAHRVVQTVAPSDPDDPNSPKKVVYTLAPQAIKSGAEAPGSVDYRADVAKATGDTKAVHTVDLTNPGNLKYTRAGEAIASGALTPGSAVHKGAVQEAGGLVKQELDAKKDFNNASTNLSMMLKTSDAAKKGDGSAQVGILANYLKTVVGGQGTGLRITKAEWDAAAKTRPWMTGIQATFSPAGIMTGAAIAPSQVDQMIQEVHQKTKALHETYQSAQQAAHAPKTAAPVTTPQTHIFDSKAWAAANPKGDVEAAKTAAKAKGYEVQ